MAARHQTHSNKFYFQTTPTPVSVPHQWINKKYFSKTYHWLRKMWLQWAQSYRVPWHSQFFAWMLLMLLILLAFRFLANMSRYLFYRSVFPFFDFVFRLIFSFFLLFFVRWRINSKNADIQFKFSLLTSIFLFRSRKHCIPWMIFGWTKKKLPSQT